MQAEGMQIIGVNIRDQEGNASKYLEEDGNPFVAVPFDPAGRTSIDWGVTAPPETFIVDGDGTVLFRFAGPLVGSDYEQRFAPALERALAN
jgi:cytochrome c biogenesis protein CcmG/thiol:disulfide interchange protein DsbE